MTLNFGLPDNIFVEKIFVHAFCKSMFLHVVMSVHIHLKFYSIRIDIKRFRIRKTFHFREDVFFLELKTVTTL